MISITSECWQCAEVLFDPSSLGRELVGVAHGVVRSISSCPPDIQATLAANIWSVWHGALSLANRLLT